MKKWLIELKSKLGKLEKLLKLFGIKPMTICELIVLEAETAQEALKQSGKNSDIWQVSTRQATKEDLIFMKC